MLNEKLEVVRPIAKKIGEVENSVNQSLALIGEMLSDIPAARIKLAKTIPLETGMAATELLAEAALSAARTYRQVVAAHAHLAEDRDAMGLRPVALGDSSNCPYSPSGELNSGLHVVSAA